MRSSLKACVAVALALVWITPALAAPAGGPDIRKVNLKKFPQVTAEVSSPKGAEGLTVLEDGDTVPGVKVSSLQTAGRGADVVLAIDSSGSMQGAPIASAISAARSFITQLPESVPVGVVAFAGTARVVSPIGADHAAASSSLSKVVASGETSLYDGVKLASGLFSGTEQHNIVLLSDGGDTASSATLQTAIKSAKKAHAAVFSVGLKTTETDVASLKSLATSTGGTYAPADAADLSTIYSGIATDIKNQYVVTYKSSATPGDQFTLTVEGPGGSDSAVLLAPKLPVHVPNQPATAPSPPLLSGNRGLYIVVGLTFVAILSLLAFGLTSKKRTDRNLARRLGVAGTVADETESDSNVAWIPDQVVEIAEKVASRGTMGQSLDRKIERAGWRIKVGEFLALVLVSGIAGGFIGSLLLQNGIFAILCAIGGGALPFLVLSIRVARRMDRLQTQLPDILMVLASSLRAGHSLLQALDAVTNEITGPGHEEFSRLITEIRLGMSLEAALDQLATRVGSDDFRWAVLAINIQRDVGGNLAEVLDTVADTMRERDAVRRQVDVLSTEGKLSVYILAGLPILIAFYMAIVNPTYLGLLFSTRIGLVMFITAACLLVLGVVWMRKVVKIDV